MKLAALLSSLALLAASATAENPFVRRQRLTPPPVGAEVEFATASLTGTSAANGTGFFTQLLNHDDPSAGTFQQRYYWNSEFWNGPGSPIVFFTPGEISAAAYGGYLTNATITGRFAQEIGGAVLMVEHRYWGASSPYEQLNSETLQQLTLKNALADFVNIAKTIDLPFDTNHSSNAGVAPWVIAGGSYSGALAAWMETLSPGTFWAYYASSAPVEAIYDYWQYFYPIQQGMPKNCSADISRVIDHLDSVLTFGSKSEVHKLKAQFGLEGVQHNDDFAVILANGPYLWQSNSFTTGYSGFYQFCDAIEGVEAGASKVPGPHGIGLKKALANYANYVNSTIIPGYCTLLGYEGDYNVECFNSYNKNNNIYTATNIHDIEVAFNDRQWVWMTCNEPFAYWQDGAPFGRPTIVSRLVTAQYYQRQCGMYFPEVNGHTYGSANPRVNTKALNAKTQGWNLVNSTRLLWTNGEFDPWRTSGVSSQFRPGGPLASTPEHPIQIIPGGFHCSDLRLSNAAANPGVQKVVDTQVAQIVEWVQQFYNQ